MNNIIQSLIPIRVNKNRNRERVVFNRGDREVYAEGCNKGSLELPPRNDQGCVWVEGEISLLFNVLLLLLFINHLKLPYCLKKFKTKYKVFLRY